MDSITAFFSSLMPDYKPKSLGTSPAPRTATTTTTTTTTSAPTESVPAAASATKQPLGESASGSNSEDIRRQREKFLNEKFGNGKSKRPKVGNIPAKQDTTPTSILAWD